MALKTIRDPDSIINLIHLGTHFELTEKLKQFIKFDVIDLNAVSLLLCDDSDIPYGHCLAYKITDEMLGFGFFNVKGDSPEEITILCDHLIEYAKMNGYEEIYGPLNVPIYIFGFGFLDSVQNDFNFASCSKHPPIYNMIFQEKGFGIKMNYVYYDVSLTAIDPYTIPGLDFSNYTLEVPENRDVFADIKAEWMALHAEHMPSEIRLTPNALREIENMLDYMFEYGYNFLIFWVRYKPTGEIVAAGMAPPNCFDIRDKGSKKGKAKSVIGLDFVVHKDHRSNRLPILMWGACSLPVVYKMKGRRCMSMVECENIRSIKIMERLGGVVNRNYLLYKKKILIG